MIQTTPWLNKVCSSVIFGITSLTYTSSDTAPSDLREETVEGSPPPPPPPPPSGTDSGPDNRNNGRAIHALNWKAILVAFAVLVALKKLVALRKLAARKRRLLDMSASDNAHVVVPRTISVDKERNDIVLYQSEEHTGLPGSHLSLQELTALLMATAQLPSSDNATSSNPMDNFSRVMALSQLVSPVRESLAADVYSVSDAVLGHNLDADEVLFPFTENIMSLVAYQRSPLDMCFPDAADNLSTESLLNLEDWECPIDETRPTVVFFQDTALDAARHMFAPVTEDIRKDWTTEAKLAVGAVFIALYHASCTLKGYFNRLRIFFVVALFALITPTLEKCAHPIGETYIPR